MKRSENCGICKGEWDIRPLPGSPSSSYPMICLYLNVKTSLKHLPCMTNPVVCRFVYLWESTLQKNVVLRRDYKNPYDRRLTCVHTLFHMNKACFNVASWYTPQDCTTVQRDGPRQSHQHSKVMEFYGCRDLISRRYSPRLLFYHIYASICFYIYTGV